MDRFTAMKIFVRIIQMGSFTAVAAEMSMTQSSISKKIAALEANLGATLFTRSNRQILLTEVGANYYEHCLSILSELEEAEAQTKDYALKPTGNLRVNVPVAFGRIHVTPYLPEFMRTYPDIKIELNCLDRKVDLLNDGFDLVIRIGHLADSNLVARKLGESPRVIVASPEYLKVHGTPKNLQDLKQHQCLVYTNLATLNIWHFWHNKKEVRVQVDAAMQTNSSDAILECALSGLGLAVMPNWLIQDKLDAGTLCTVLDNYVPTLFPINAVYPQNHYTPLKVRCFINFIKEKYSQDTVLNAKTV